MTAATTASAQPAPIDGGLLRAPPPDVSGLLHRHGTALPLYFDGQLADAERRSRRDWPCLWRLAPDRE